MANNPVNKKVTRRQFLKGGGMLAAGLFILPHLPKANDLPVGNYLPRFQIKPTSGVDLLVHAFEHAKAQKGWIQEARNASSLTTRPWGQKEGLPNYVRINITDLTEADVAPFLQPIRNEFTYTLVEDRGVTRIYDVTVPSKVLTIGGQDKGLTPDVLEMFTREYSSFFVEASIDNSRLRIETPASTFRALQDTAKDYYELVVENRRYRIKDSDVNLALISGGTMAVTAAQIVPGIVDRLA